MIVPHEEETEGEWNGKKRESGCLMVDEAMQTSVPGVFAVSDVLCNHVKQAVIAAAEGTAAAVSVQQYGCTYGLMRILQESKNLLRMEIMRSTLVQ